MVKKLNLITKSESGEFPLQVNSFHQYAIDSCPKDYKINSPISFLMGHQSWKILPALQAHLGNILNISFFKGAGYSVDLSSQLLCYIFLGRK